MLYFPLMTRSAQLQLLSRYENIELAEGMLAELCAGEQVDDEFVYWVGMALREAVANAIKHGNKLNPEKRVHISMRLEPGVALFIEVEDEGEGFEPAEIADPTDPANLLRESGRGVFYIRHFMDEVRFSIGESGGTRLELTKRLDAKEV